MTAIILTLERSTDFASSAGTTADSNMAGTSLNTRLGLLVGSTMTITTSKTSAANIT